MENHTPIEQARQRLRDLISSFRKDGQQADNPMAGGLFETSAEVLVGLERAFDHFATRAESAWRK